MPTASKAVRGGKKSIYALHWPALKSPNGGMYNSKNSAISDAAKKFAKLVLLQRNGLKRTGDINWDTIKYTTVVVVVVDNYSKENFYEYVVSFSPASIDTNRVDASGRKIIANVQSRVLRLNISSAKKDEIRKMIANKTPDDMREKARKTIASLGQ